MTQLTQDQIDKNRDKRPLYAVGQQLRVTAEDSRFNGWIGEVTGISPFENLAGIVVTYFYHLRMLNLGHQQWPEEQLAPLPEARP
jgi:hypothetical protein